MSMNREQELQHRNDELLMKLTNVVAGYKQLQATIEQQAAKIAELREALKFYADSSHFIQHQDVWESVSGEPMNFLEDENSTATVEDGSIAKHVLASTDSTWLAEHDKEVRRKVLNEAYKEVNCGITHVRWALEIIHRMAEQPESKS